MCIEESEGQIDLERGECHNGGDTDKQPTFIIGYQLS